MINSDLNDLNEEYNFQSYSFKIPFDDENKPDYNMDNEKINNKIENENDNGNEDKEIKAECIKTEQSSHQKKEEVILDIFKDKEKEKMKKCLLGRKKKDSNEPGKHNKFSEDNIIKKIKSNLLLILLKFINIEIDKIYKGNIGHGIFQKHLLKINQNQVIISKNNKQFLTKTLKDIFSDDISTKYSFFSVSHNRELIQALLNENDEEKRIKFNKLFNLTFIDCLKHFRGSVFIEELSGLGSLDSLLKKFEGDKEYLHDFKFYCLNLEDVIQKKKNRDVK